MIGDLMLKDCKIHGLTKFSEGKRPRCRACNVVSVTNRRRKLKQLSIEYMGGCCSVCGYEKYQGALEFHHLDPNEKDFAISEKGYTKSFEKIKEELDKCILVCSNCHREIHGLKVLPSQP